MDGVLVIDKPEGISSHDIVREVKRLPCIDGKVGHTGTLDPMATGVLPLCIGRATRLSSFLMKGRKEYLATMKLGEETDTLDREGKVVYRAVDKIQVGAGDISRALKLFIGEISQVPPVYSAIKKNGVPLYKLARKGIKPKMETRKVFIYELELTRIDLPFVSFKAVVSSGTYVRALCRDIGRELGCYAYLYGLRRIRSGDFSIGESFSLEEFKSAPEENLRRYLIPIEKLLRDIPAVEVDGKVEEKLLNGAPPVLGMDFIIKGGVRAQSGEKVRFVSIGGRLLSIAEIMDVKDGKVVFSLLRVFA